MKSSFYLRCCILSAVLAPCLPLPVFAQEWVPSLGSAFAEDHPRRTEVLRSDANLQNQIQQDAGQLGANAPGLQNTANNIASQEEQYARRNGGYITIPEWQQLDAEEAALQNSINSDMQGTVNPWQDYGQNTNAGTAAQVTPPSGLLSILGGYTRPACGFAGNGGFPSNTTSSQLMPALAPTSTSSIDINTAF